MHVTLKWSITAIVGFLLWGPVNASAADPVVVRLAQNLSPISGLAIIAERNGLFRAEGLDVRVNNFTSGKQCLTTVIGGGADIASTAEAPITAAAMSGIAIALLARMEYSDLKTLTAASAHIDRLADLKGKRIAFTAGTGSEVYTVALLKKANLTARDVTLINLPPQDMLPALAAGSIDAYDTWEPHIANGEKALGAQAKQFTTTGIYSETFNIVVLRDYLVSHEATAEAFLRALIAAETWAKVHPAAAIAVVASVTGMRPEDLTRIWKDYVFHIALDRKQLDILKAHAEWRLASGNHPDGATMPDFSRFIAPAPLRRVAPERMTVSRP